MNSLKKAATYLGLALPIFISTAVVPGLPKSVQAPPVWGQAAPKTQTLRFPLSLNTFIPCAVGSTGEYVLLSGTLYSQFQVTQKSNTTFQVVSQVNPEEISGVGQTSGDVYQGVALSPYTFNARAGSQSSFVSSFRVVGQQPGNDFVVYQTFRVTVNGTGQVTASVDKFKAVCQ